MIKNKPEASLILHRSCLGPLIVSSAVGAQGHIIWAVGKALSHSARVYLASLREDL